MFISYARLVILLKTRKCIDWIRNIIDDFIKLTLAFLFHGPYSTQSNQPNETSWNQVSFYDPFLTG